MPRDEHQRRTACRSRRRVPHDRPDADPDQRGGAQIHARSARPPAGSPGRRARRPGWRCRGSSASCREGPAKLATRPTASATPPTHGDLRGQDDPAPRDGGQRRADHPGTVFAGHRQHAEAARTASRDDAAEAVVQDLGGGGDRGVRPVAESHPGPGRGHRDHRRDRQPPRRPDAAQLDPLHPGRVAESRACRRTGVDAHGPVSLKRSPR